MLSVCVSLYMKVIFNMNLFFCTQRSLYSLALRLIYTRTLRHALSSCPTVKDFTCHPIAIKSRRNKISTNSLCVALCLLLVKIHIRVNKEYAHAIEPCRPPRYERDRAWKVLLMCKILQKPTQTYFCVFFFSYKDVAELYMEHCRSLRTGEDKDQQKCDCDACVSWVRMQTNVFASLYRKHFHKNNDYSAMVFLLRGFSVRKAIFFASRMNITSLRDCPEKFTFSLNVYDGKLMYIYIFISRIGWDAVWQKAGWYWAIYIVKSAICGFSGFGRSI